jgi:hypothetical protein
MGLAHEMNEYSANWATEELVGNEIGTGPIYRQECVDSDWSDPETDGLKTSFLK